MRSASVRILLSTAIGLGVVAPAHAQQTPGDQSGTPTAAGAGQSAATPTNAPAAAPAEAAAPAAEAAPARRARGGDDGPGDIIVTARRVEERLQDVPISITVFNQQQLQNRNVTTAQDLAQYTPSLSVDTRFGGNNSNFALRGFVQDIGTPPSVGVYFADVVSPRAASNNLPVGNGAGPGNFFDLQNVQVLKGPQGTLFGRNTTGGAVLLVPQKPTSKLEGYVEGSYGNYDMRRLQAVANIPLSEVARFRIGVDYQKRDGYLKNRSGIGSDNYDDIDYIAARASLVVDLTPDLENYTVGSYLRSNSTGYVGKVVDAGGARAPSTAGAGEILLRPLAAAQLAREQAAGFGFYDIESDFPIPKTVLDQWQIINTTTWRASDTLTVKNIASYSQLIVDYYNPIFGTNFNVKDAFGGVLGSGPISFASSYPQPGGHTAQQSTFTEELQFQGKSADDKLVWQAGAYYELSQPLGPSGSLSPILAYCTDIYAFQCITPLARFGAGGASITSAETTFRDVGLYAQATYSITDRLKLTGGFRYTWDRTKADASSVDYAITSPGVAVPTCAPFTSTLAQGCTFSTQQKSRAPTWLINLDFKPTDDLLLYAKWARGYRSGGVTPQSPPSFRTFEPEKVDTYEVGAKATFRGAVRGYLNIAAFYNDFSNQQVQVNIVRFPAAFFTATQNLGKSRIYGAEVEASITPVDGFTLDASYAYLNTKVKKVQAFADFPPYDVGSPVTEGDPLFLSPKNKVSVTATYTLPLDESIGKISLGATFTHTDKQVATGATPTNDPNNPFVFLEATNLLNLNLNWRSIAGTPIDLSLFATNVTRQKYFAAISGTLNTTGFETASIGEPRMFGARLRYRFGAR